MRVRSGGAGGFGHGAGNTRFTLASSFDGAESVAVELAEKAARRPGVAGRARAGGIRAPRVLVAVDQDRSTASTLPEVSPFFHSRPREREWKCAEPVARVAASASASMNATISTSPLSASVDHRA